MFTLPLELYRFIKSKTQKFIYLYILCTVLIGCSGNKSDENIKILATVGDRVISVDEYVERAELTPRQPYCSSNTPRDKAIVLNTLIAEKVLAIEVQDNADLLDNERFQYYLLGRKEQYMRDLYFNDLTYNTINLDTAEIVNAYEFAGREYGVEYRVINKTESERMKKRFKNNPAEQAIIFDDIGLTVEHPRRKISWNDQETPDIVHSNLFTQQHQINEVIGPIQTGYDEYLVMKIVEWKDNKSFGGTQSLERWNDVKKKLTKFKANKIWEEYTSNLMKGKKIEFNRPSFLKVFKLFEAWFSKNNERKNHNLNLSMDELDEDNLSHSLSDEQFLQSPFCIIDQRIWLVADLKKAVMSHPLVLRKGEAKNRQDLEQQFMLAIADLIRDQYITQDAYDKGYDKKESVKRYVQKWHDAYAAVYHRDKFLKIESRKKDFNKSQMRGSNSYLSMYLDSLLTVYHDKIAINQPLFEEIKFTSTPMFALNHNRPFVMATPAFPLLTDTDKLNYKFFNINYSE